MEVGTETYNSVVANALRRNKFKQIKHFTNCADTEQLPENDKFRKVGPLLNMLNKNV